MRCEPVPFQTQHRQMLYVRNKHIQIDGKRFHKLVTTLRTAVAKEGILDKEATSYDDVLDAMRLCVRGFEQVQHDNPTGYSTDIWTDEQVAAVITTETEEIEEEYQEEEEEEEEERDKPTRWQSVKHWGIGY
jgi:hypothetical protein